MLINWMNAETGEIYENHRDAVAAYREGIEIIGMRWDGENWNEVFKWVH